MTHNLINDGPKIALFEPDIPQNTAAIIRTCACLGAKLEIIEPCGFLLNDKRFKRVVMDYMDEKVNIGPADSANSYLNIKNIIKAAKDNKADAVHPGYGFLSENAEFSKALKKEKITFIGPSMEAIQSMGDKIISKRIAKKAGVNTY